MDIAMCENSSCPSKEYCFRFTAKPTEFYQSYTDFTVEDDAVNCSYFWANGKDSNKCKLNGIKKEGQMCNREECDYPNCTKDDYCTKCHQINNVHKISCENNKIILN